MEYICNSTTVLKNRTIQEGDIISKEEISKLDSSLLKNFSIYVESVETEEDSLIIESEIKKQKEEERKIQEEREKNEITPHYVLKNGRYIGGNVYITPRGNFIMKDGKVKEIKSTCSKEEKFCVSSTPDLSLDDSKESDFIPLKKSKKLEEIEGDQIQFNSPKFEYYYYDVRAVNIPISETPTVSSKPYEDM